MQKYPFETSYGTTKDYTNKDFLRSNKQKPQVLHLSSLREKAVLALIRDCVSAQANKIGNLFLDRMLRLPKSYVQSYLCRQKLHKVFSFVKSFTTENMTK